MSQAEMVRPGTHPQTGSPPDGSKLLLIALVLALIAVVLTNVYIERERKADQASFVVYQLTRSVQPGDRLKEGDYIEAPVPEIFRDTFSSRLDEKGLRVKIRDGDPFMQAAAKGDILTYKLFRTADDDPDIDQRITRGKRLVSLPINSRIQPGSLRPGMYVDIAAPFQTGGQLPEVLVIMEYVRVQAVGRMTISDESGSRGPGSYQTITIELTPEQAAIMSMIQRLAVGDFDLYLRNPADTTLKIKEVDFEGINRQVVREIEKRIGRPLFSNRTP